MADLVAMAALAQAAGRGAFCDSEAPESTDQASEFLNKSKALMREVRGEERGWRGTDMDDHGCGVGC